MERSTALIICWMVVAPATLLFPAIATAIPASQSSLLAGTEPIPDFSGVASAPPTAEPRPTQKQPVAGEPAATGDTVIAAATVTHDASAVPDIPCMSSFVDEEPSGEGVGGEPCDGASDLQRSVSVRFGERLGPGSGILGEFDGIRVDYRLTGGLTLNGVAGYPVLSSHDKFNVTGQIFGVSASTGKFARAWDLNSYVIEGQDAGGTTSREIGGALRYLRAKRSLLVFLDYDAADHALGAAMASGALLLPYRTTISATLDVRNNPLHKRQENFLRQSMAATEGWAWELPTDRITHYTKDLSEEVTTLAVGMTHTFSERIKLRGGFARLEASSEAGRDNQSAGATKPSEYFYHLNLSGTNLMFPGDSNVLNLSHRITESSRTSSASLDSRYIINRHWNVSPQLRTDYYDNPLDRSVKWVTSPSVKMEYHWRELYGFKIEAGGKWLTEQASDAEKSQTSYYLSLGYVAKF